LNVPSVATTIVTNITTNSAISGGNVINSGNGTITARGVCWNTTVDPTLQNCIDSTFNGSGLGSFASNITELIPNTTYYVRSYATNEEGTGYGNQVSFTTTQITIPTVTTSSITNITNSIATSGGDVTYDGGATVTSRGVCWSILEYPTTLDNHSYDGSGTGSFVSSLIGLTPETIYFVRAYATNSEGTSYGNQLSFTTLPNPWQCGDQITYEGQTYNTLLVGDQCWFKENLNVGTMLTGSQYPSNNGVKEKYCYDDNTDNCTIFGGLYDWE
jgi:hypothetical protein